MDIFTETVLPFAPLATRRRIESLQITLLLRVVTLQLCVTTADRTRLNNSIYRLSSRPHHSRHVQHKVITLFRVPHEEVATVVVEVVVIVHIAIPTFYSPLTPVI